MRIILVSNRKEAIPSVLFKQNLIGFFSSGLGEFTSAEMQTLVGQLDAAGIPSMDVGVNMGGKTLYYIDPVGNRVSRPDITAIVGQMVANHNFSFA